MADELTISVSLAFLKGSKSASFLASGEKFDVAGTKYTRMTQTIGTSEEAIDLGDVGTAGYMLIVNRDATNIVHLRPGSGAANFAKLRPGGWALVELSNAPWAIALVAACEVEYLLIEA